MFDWLRPFLDVETLSPHGICLLWRPELIWTHAVSDVLIGVAYFSIPLALGVFLYHRRDVRFSWAIWMFVLFIMLCGVTHFMMVWTLWNPDYGIEALTKAATAVASVVTALALWPLLPKAIAIPSTGALQARIDERDAALAELRVAMATMVRMEEHQKEQARLLEEINRREARLRSIFDNAAVGIGRVAIDGRFLEVNARFLEIAGWPEEALLSGGIQKITHPEDLEGDFEHVQALLDGSSGSYAMEKRYVRADGTVVWVHLTGSLVRDANGEPDHFVSIVDDITEEKRIAETRDLLLREVDHRARNALTVVQSVVRLTQADDPVSFKETVIGRVDALARAQASLARASWAGSALEDIVSEELASIADPSQFEAIGPSIHVEPGQVQPLSMILHELATNAAKYGALSMDGGRVTISWERRGSEWSLQWKEQGGPQVKLPERAGFGSRLVRRLASELNGRIEMTWRPEGLLVELTALSGPPATGESHPFIGALARQRTKGPDGPTV